ncbi:MAG TPA: response regulator [Planctomycetota bacterium]|nr:response regulator [Planctomycetota bacterium]
MPHTILHVDDNLADREILREALAESGVEAELQSVSSQAQALRFVDREGEFAKAAEPAAILLDLSMPGPDGRELMLRLRTSDLHKRIPLIVLTASASSRDQHDGEELADAYWRKPDTYAGLVTLLRDGLPKVLGQPSTKASRSRAGR